MNTNPTFSTLRYKHFSSLSVFICVHLWLISSALAASIPLPQGIADPEGRTGFFASASGGIEALDLATGKVLWQTHEAQLPLLLDGHRLLAQAGIKRNRLRILGLDCKNHGECDLESDPVVFPAWVVTGQADGHSFAPHWRLDKHHLVLDWQARAWHAGKEHPAPEEKQTAYKHANGVVRIDLRTGQIESLPRPNLGQRKEELTPSLPEKLQEKALRWQGLVGNCWKVLVLEEAENGHERFVLHSVERQSRTEQKPKELLRGKRLLVRPTLDERILCLYEARPSPNPDERGLLMPKKAPNWWWLFSVQTGELVGRIPDEAGMNSIAVLGKRVFYLAPGTLHGALHQANVQPQILRVIDLSSGKKLWEHPVAGKLMVPPPL
jgi:hypothetical protein